MPASVIQPRRLTTENLPLSARSEAWREGLAALSLRSGGPSPDDAGGTIATRPSSTGAALGLVTGPAQILARLAPADREPPIHIMLCLKGRGRAVTVRHGFEISEHDLCVLDVGLDWRIEWRTDFDIVVVEVPRGTIEFRLGRSRPELTLTLAGTFAATAAKPLMRMLAANVGEIDQADLSAAEIAVTELVVSALLAEARENRGTMTEVQSSHFRRVAAAIEARLAQPDLAIGDIARQEGMSVRYVQRLFERRNRSFSEYVRQQRLDRCRADLADPNHAHESVAAIGLRWGFRDQAHFSRSFSAAFGLSPREVRKAGDGPVQPYALRGKPGIRVVPPAPPQPPRPVAISANRAAAPDEAHRKDGDRRLLPVNAGTVHWGYLGNSIAPALRVPPDSIVTVETLTQHAADDWERMVAHDPGAESVFEWTAGRKAVDRRGAGPMNASIFGRGAGEGFGVHIMTGPIHVRGAEPGDVIEVEFLEIRPRPCANPAHPGRAFASNASAWWGFQYNDLLDKPATRETVTIYEIDLARPTHARPLYSYVWTPQTDPYGVTHHTIDYPGVPVDPATVQRRADTLAGVRIPARPHFGFVSLAPREAEIVDSIPPGYFGGNIDNWRAGAGSRIYLPVAVEGGLLSMGDGHFAQGDGEVNGTGLECSLTADIRIRLHKRGAAPAYLHGLNAPLIETDTHWIVQGFSYHNYLRELGREAQSTVYTHSTVDLALRNAFRQTRRFLMDVYGLREDEALSVMSLAVDFGVTQVADGNLGVHATIDKTIFAERR